METIESVEQYKSLIAGIKERHGKPSGNLYFMYRDVVRYIAQGRLLVEEGDGGCVFYVDGHTYYQTAVYGNLDKDFCILPQDKKCIVRLVYDSKGLMETQQRLSRILRKNGFHKEATTVQVQGRTGEILEKCKSIEPYIKKMETQGYFCVMAQEDQFEEIDKLICDSGVVKDYHMAYMTPEEKKALQKGSYLCIVNKDREICGASLTAIVDGMAQGGAVVMKEEYKLKGLTPILTYNRAKWLREQNVEYTHGWIVTTNVGSVRYHTGTGFRLMDKYADEWLLHAKEGLIDSFEIMNIIMQLEKEFDMEIDPELILPENFCSLEAIEALIGRLI